MFQELTVFLSMVKESYLISFLLISLRSGLILSRYLYIDFPVSSFHEGCPTINWQEYLFLLCLPHALPILNFITLMKCLGEYISWHFLCNFFWSVVISSCLGPDIFFSTDVALTSKIIHVCTCNSVFSWWFSFPFKQKIVLLCWFCTRDVSSDKLSH